MQIIIFFPTILTRWNWAIYMSKQTILSSRGPSVAVVLEENPALTGGPQLNDEVVANQMDPFHGQEVYTIMY